MNKSKSIAILGLAAATAFAGSAFAQATQERGFYAGLAIGQSDVQDFDCAGAATCDKKDTAFKIFGGYQIMRYLAAELAYTDMGKAKASDAGDSLEFKSSAFELVAVGSYPIGTSGFAPYVKAGIYYGKTEASATLGGFSGSVEDNHTDWTAGIGLRYDITRNFAVRAEWQRYNGVGGTIGGVDLGSDTAVDVISIGALYKF